MSTNLFIANTFRKSLAKLTNQEQKQVKTAVADLLLNPEAKGLNPHSIDDTKQGDFWSARATKELRIIFSKQKDSHVLCHVGHHDPAYEWAKRHQLKQHPTTGAAQLISLETKVHTQIVYEQTHAPRSPLFEAYAEAELLSYGVPDELISHVKRINDMDTLYTLIDHLPEEAFLALTELAEGRVPVPRQVLEAYQDALEHPDAQQRFVRADSLEQLDALLQTTELSIDADFVSEWELAYDLPRIANDETEYNQLIVLLSERPVLSAELLLRLIRWKSPRSVHFINLMHLERYQQAFLEVYKQPHEVRNNLNKLMALPGIGLPVASTLLHLIYPDNYPILDVRTVEVLFLSGHIPFYSESDRSKPHLYVQFRQAVFDLTETLHISLRRLDRALFAYHKYANQRGLLPAVSSQETTVVFDAQLNAKELNRWAHQTLSSALAEASFEVEAITLHTRTRALRIKHARSQKNYIVQLRSCRNYNYLFFEKAKFQPDPQLLAGLVIVEADVPRLYLVPSPVWLNPESEGLADIFTSNDYLGKKSEPEWGVQLSERKMERISGYLLAEMVDRL